MVNYQKEEFGAYLHNFCGNAEVCFSCANSFFVGAVDNFCHVKTLQNPWRRISFVACYRKGWSDFFAKWKALQMVAA